MASSDSGSNRGNSYVTTVIIAVVLLILLYLLARGCKTTSVEHSPGAHTPAATSGH